MRPNRCETTQQKIKKKRFHNKRELFPFEECIMPEYAGGSNSHPGHLVKRRICRFWQRIINTGVKSQGCLSKLFCCDEIISTFRHVISTTCQMSKYMSKV